MIVDSFFRPDFTQESEIFNDGEPPRPPPARLIVVNSSSIDTRAIDAWRQGVEITHLKHYDAGIIKIHAGEPGHRWRDRRYGLEKGFRSSVNEFEETTTFDPEGYIRDQEDGVIDNYTYPIVTRDFDAAQNYEFNGIIEPLTIRGVASFFTNDVPFEAHAAVAGLMGGNMNSVRASDRIMTVDYVKNDVPVPFLDMVDMMGGMPTIGYFDTTQTRIEPFVEQNLPNGMPVTTNMSNDLVSALSRMGTIMTGSLTGSVGMDSYVRYNQIAATSGWSYEDVAGVGTDSLAFGGLRQ